MSSKYQLSQPELDELERAHHQATDKRFADRIKTVFLLGKGWTTSRVAEALSIDRETVRNHFKRYRKG
ncbi:MAG: helix-turn-helix domain-containing protein, partial [Gammaproteobacteria bacterium]|nr:helix-turn-helix domain-containing protein [Gammaproteobacteria bacterium]